MVAAVGQAKCDPERPLSAWAGSRKRAAVNSRAKAASDVTLPGGGSQIACEQKGADEGPRGAANREAAMEQRHGRQLQRLLDGDAMGVHRHVHAADHGAHDEARDNEERQRRRQHRPEERQAQKNARGRGHGGAAEAVDERARRPAWRRRPRRRSPAAPGRTRRGQPPCAPWRAEYAEPMRRRSGRAERKWQPPPSGRGSRKNWTWDSLRKGEPFNSEGGLHMPDPNAGSCFKARYASTSHEESGNCPNLGPLGVRDTHCSSC